MGEEEQGQQDQDQSQPQGEQPKAIDSVKPAPRLSGEGQDEHLDEADSRQESTPAKREEQQAPKKQDKEPSNFPGVAVFMAVFTATVITVAVVYLAMNQS